jgi:hypothetical protein
MEEYCTLCGSCLKSLGINPETRREIIIGRTRGEDAVCRGCGFRGATRYKCTTEEILKVRKLLDNADA